MKNKKNNKQIRNYHMNKNIIYQNIYTFLIYFEINNFKILHQKQKNLF